MHLPGIQTFYNPNNLSIPLEYEITPVDEITNIFDIYSDENYTIFINESLKIFEKYKTKCNPKNKKLILYTSECDGSFKNNYTHGGYECGDNGNWTTNCVPSYCDIGYIFDYNKSECIIDVCYYDENNDDPTNNFFKYLIISLIAIAFIIIVIIIVIIICKKVKSKESESNEVKNISLLEQSTD